jgi:hypothetical protein
MKESFLKIKEAVTTNLGCAVNEDRLIYSTFFVLPVNIVAELFFFINTYILALPMTFLKIFVKKRQNSLGIYGSMIVVLIIYPLSTKNKDAYYLIVALFHILAYWASFSILVVKNTPISGVFILNKVITAILTTIGTMLVMIELTGASRNIDSLYSASAIILLFSLFGSKYRASLGRRASLIMIASSLLAPVTPLYYLAGAGLSVVFVLAPAIYRFNQNQHGKAKSEFYGHRDLEIMKLFGQSSASGYAFEERLIPLIDSAGYDTKFSKWYKDNKDYPIEYSQTKGDGGIDLIAMSSDSILVIQCKFYNKAITADIVAKTFISHKAFVNHYAKKGDRRKVTAMIITNGKFDNTAIADAKAVGMILVDGDAINKMAMTGKI